MKKLYSLCALFIVTILLNGCILSPEPGVHTANINAGDSRTFGITIFPDDPNIRWEFNGSTVQGATGKYFTYTPTLEDVTESDNPHILEVFASNDSRTWRINVSLPPPPPYGDITDPAQAQEILYSAYAGIGYGNAGSVGDDAFLYKVMLADLNTLPQSLVMDTIMNDPNNMQKLIDLILWPEGQSFVYNHNAGRFNLWITATAVPFSDGKFNFNGTLNAYLNETGDGYNNYGCTYFGKGDTSSSDLTVRVTGNLTIQELNLTEFNFGSITIEAKPGLKASYSSPSVDVLYDNWKIQYSVQYGAQVNVAIVPQVMGSQTYTEDNRNYTLSGGFSIGSDAYLFGEDNAGVQYQQTDNQDDTYNLMINGVIESPSLEYGPIIVDANNIISNSSGVWTSGGMILSGIDLTTGEETNYDIIFDSGDASGDPDSWSLAYWQSELAPF